MSNLRIARHWKSGLNFRKYVTHLVKSHFNVLHVYKSLDLQATMAKYQHTFAGLEIQSERTLVATHGGVVTFWHKTGVRFHFFRKWR